MEGKGNTGSAYLNKSDWAVDRVPDDWTVAITCTNIVYRKR